MGDPLQPPIGDAANPTATNDAAATSAVPLYPAWVLLDKVACYRDGENATTAEATTFTGQTVRVTFFLADPPAVSSFAVLDDQKDLLGLPRAVFSAKDLVLLRFVFAARARSTVVPRRSPDQYFVYKVGHGGKPSLTPIPTSDRPNNYPSYPAIVTFEDQDGNFLVAELAMTKLAHYDLHIFSSKTNAWTTRPLQLQVPPAATEDLPRTTHKVIALGAGTVGWIDLWRGIVVCNVFDLNPVLRFIPLPKPEFNLRLEGDPQRIRDVTCCNGFVKFVEMEHYPRPDTNTKRNFKTTKDLDSAVVLYDEELFLRSSEDLEEQPGPLDWKIRTCYRHTSWNLWCKGHTVHVDDILVDDPSYYMMLPELWDVNARKFTLANLTAVCPTLSIHGGNVVYLVLKVVADDEEAWMVGVDLRKKTVELLEPYSAGRSCLHQTPFLACTFSRYLNTPRYLHNDMNLSN